MKEMLIRELEARKDRSAWNKGVTNFAIDLIDGVEDGTNITRKTIQETLLNGADNWMQYSYGGCYLIYDGDIAKALCTPSELKRKRGGELQPNSRETWLDVQARALSQACARIKAILRRLEEEEA